MTSRNANLYITLADFKRQYLNINTYDTTNDDDISQVIEEASRSIDDACGRFFFPNVDTLSFDTPCDDRLRFWYDDLLEPITVTNGSSGALSSSDYYLIPYNHTPYIALALKSGTGQSWTSDSDNITEKAIGLLGIWGYRTNYARDGWHALTTLSSAVNDDTTAFPVADGTGVQAGDLLRADNEIVCVTLATASSLTVERGWNGSTAAAHLINAPLKRWYTEPVVVRAAGLQAHRLYKRKDAPFGTISGGEFTVKISNIDQDVAALIRPFVRMF